MIDDISKRLSNPETGEMWDVIAGGLAWPGAYPDLAIVLGVSNFPRLLRGYNLKWIAELEERDFDLFLTKVGEASRLFRVSTWYADFPSEFEREAVADFNRATSHQLRIQPAPYGSDPRRLYIYAMILRRKLDPVNPSLFMDGTSYPKPSLDLQEILMADPEEHPFLTALGSVTAALDNFTGSQDLERLAREDEEHNQWDPFNL